MTIEEIKTPQDILTYMYETIAYGWLDINNEEHINNLKDYRELYRTSSIEETISHGLGTCIEQTYLMSFLLTKLGIPNKMFCLRIYENNDLDNIEYGEDMHCFVLYYLNDKVYQIEHPDRDRIGIYEYPSEEQALKELVVHYSTIFTGDYIFLTEFSEVPYNISYKNFNLYINELAKQANSHHLN